ncbi:MAG: hypothetical protein ACLT9P_04345 [Evtepia gabavorous]
MITGGGSEAAITECGVAGFINMQALSTSEDPNAACLPFADKRRGGLRHREAWALAWCWRSMSTQ